MALDAGDVTVVVSTYNRTRVLERCVAGLLGQRPAPRIVLLDNGSDLPEALALLEELSEGFTVYRFPAITGDYEKLGTHLNHVLEAEHAAPGRPRWFGITDADVVLDGPADSLATYVLVADALRVAAGPHHRPNVHRNYPLRSRVLVEQTFHLYRSAMDWLTAPGRAAVPFGFVPIDTTLHVFPAEPGFRRFRLDTVRVGPPYWASHLDWTIDGLAPRPDELAYARSAGDLGSWGKTWIRGVLDLLEESPERAFAEIARDAAAYDAGDFANPRFVLAWMLQYGIGCDVDVDRSRSVLRSAVPRSSQIWERAAHWDELVFAGSFAPLGWGENECP